MSIRSNLIFPITGQTNLFIICRAKIKVSPNATVTTCIQDSNGSWAGKDVQLSLGAIDDNDITYWNGIEIGRTDGPTLQRKYIIPEKMVKAGKAILAIRVLDTSR